ncbi:MAG TPA: hypothetical protein VMZ29_00780 [Candidatus Bathyarchaeia archaeon]|nr:hypothetical protein [Candidatus Bathyarchaeia archaeon]
MNDTIKSIFGIDSYYSPRAFKALNSNIYYQTIFQLHIDSLQLLLLSEDPKIAALYTPHFESFLGYLKIYKDYAFNSQEIFIEQQLGEKWKRRQFIGLMREMFTSEKPEYMIHFLGRVFLGEIPDIKVSSWKFGKYPANYTEKTHVKSMLIHHVNFVEHWNEFQKFHKLLEKYYPEGINKQGTHKIPKKKDICELVLLHPYVPDVWMDLARISKKEKKDSAAITYLRIALCLDHTRYDIWKELILFDPSYSNTNIPQLDDELNIIINNKIVQAENQLEEEKQQQEATEIVQQVNTLVNRHNAFNEISQIMRDNPTEPATPLIAPSNSQSSIPSSSPSSTLPSYFEYLRGVPGINLIEIVNKIERAIAALPRKNLEAIQHIEMVAQQAFKNGDLNAALDLFLSVIHISAQIGEIKHQILALSNLGIYFSNARRYDIARKYANEAKVLATKNNLLEEKLQALKVLGLIQTNDNKDPRDRITILEETAEILRQLGREGERQQILAQIDTFKQFLDLLGK